MKTSLLFLGHMQIEQLKIRHHRAYNPSLVLVQPRKTRPYITERVLMGRESNQTNKQTKPTERFV